MLKLQSGEVFDHRFTILEELGEGGMGTVYAAEQKELGRKVAIKILQDPIADADSLERFNREGRILSSIQHPAIVEFYHFGLCQGHAYMAMELVEGRSLRTELQRCGRLAWRRAVKIIAQVCEAMAYAHNADVVHRDLKPDNIILLNDSEDEIKIIDFGLGRLQSESQQLTATGMLVGSVHYMSPEQCQGKKATKESDVYALGCTLYELVAGVTAFEADNPIGLLHKHNTEYPRKLSDLLKGECPPELDQVLFKAIAKDPEQRYDDLMEMRSHLELLAANRVNEVPKDLVTLSNPARKGGLLLAAGLSVAAVVGVVVLLIGSGIKPSPTIVQTTETKTKFPRKPIGSTHWRWHRLQDYCLKLVDRGAQTTAIEEISDWLDYQRMVKTLTVEDAVSAGALLSKCYMANTDPTTAIKIVSKTIDQVKGAATDEQMCSLLATRLGYTGWLAWKADIKRDADLLQKYVQESRTLSDRHKAMLWLTIIEARMGEGKMEEALLCCRRANESKIPDSFLIEQIAYKQAVILFLLKRTDQALESARTVQKLRRALLPAVLSEDQKVGLQMLVAEIAAQAKLWNICVPVVEECLKSPGCSVRTQADLHKFYADWSLNCWGDAGRNNGPIRNFDQHPDEWRAALLSAEEHFGKAARLYASVGDMMNQRSCLCYQHCCLGALGNDQQAQKVLKEALSVGQLTDKEAKACVAGTLWCVGSLWLCMGWHQESTTAFRSSYELYSQLQPGFENQMERAKDGLAEAMKRTKRKQL